MSDSDEARKRLEAIVGKITPWEDLPLAGTDDPPFERTVYFSSDGKSRYRKQFNKITCYEGPPHPTSGGVNGSSWRITPPGGPLFCALSYHGDLEGWGKSIELGAKANNALLAWIKGDDFVISDGRVVKLADCKIERDI